MNRLSKFENGPWPTINEDAVKIVDRYARRYYVYGGTRWAANDDLESPTCEWNTDFHKLCLSTFKWENIGYSFRKDPASLTRSPMSGAVVGERDCNKTFATATVPPRIGFPIGALFHYNDREWPDTSYLFIFGDAEDDPDQSYPILICLDMRIYVWGEVVFKGSRKLKKSRDKASMILVGKPCTPSFYLCIFGGEDEDGSPFDTYAVANITEQTWVVTDEILPDNIEPIGLNPTLIESEGKILIFRREQVATEWGSATLYDPELDTFANVNANDKSNVPRPAEFYEITHSLDKWRDVNYMSYIYHSWDEERDVCGTDISVASRNLTTWKLTFSKGEPESGSTKVSRKGKRRFQEDEESDTDSVDCVPSAPLRLVWTPVLHERINGVLNNLKHDMQVEQAILQGDLWDQPDGFSDVPRLILLGYCRTHQGEVRGRLYSGYVSCSLDPLRARHIFGPDDGQVDEEYHSDSSSSLSYETLPTSPSDVPGSSEVILSELPRPLRSETPSGLAFFDNEDGPVLVPDEQESEAGIDIDIDQVKVPDESFSDSDWELEYPTEETPPPVDETDHFMDSFMQFENVVPSC